MSSLSSMTGYGAATAPCLGGRVSVEVRTVNHRYCDIKTRLPRECYQLEPKIVSTVKKRIGRGHVEVSVRWDERPTERAEAQLDLNLARSYRDAYQRLCDELKLGGEVTVALLANHDVVAARETPGAPDEIWEGVEAALDDAIRACVEMREVEGRALEKDLRGRTANLGELHLSLVKLAPVTIDEQRNRLRQRVLEIAEGVAIDEARMAQEIAFLVEKGDISEELGRIASHLQQVASTLDEAKRVGRKLDFLCQELHREINTVGAKSQSGDLTGLVVEFKSELEKLREQVQNAE